MDLYIGCPIWSNKEWVGSLYPEGTKASAYLREYSRRLTTVEGNTTFYAVPSPAMVERWVNETPPFFRFCLKLPRVISHGGKVMDHRAETEHFLGIVGQLGERLGPFFLQLPPAYPPALIEDLREFLGWWPTHLQLAVEVRHPAWFDSPHHPNLQALLASHQMARVIIDTRPIRSLKGDTILKGSVYERLLQARERKPNLPVVPEPTASFTFLRYIGHPHLEQNAPFLDEWAGHLAKWIGEGRDAYVFCHCPDESLDPQLCRVLHQRVQARVPVSPLPQPGTDSGPMQARLFA
jgi:uncharacterized protein YecE (DUF72 family)